MRAKVGFVVAGVGEGAPAVLAGAQEVAVVLLQVPREVATKRERAATLGADERALPRVRTHVFHNVSACGERLATLITFVPLDA